MRDRLEREEQLALLQERKRRHGVDPLFQFQPHAKQQAFIDALLEGTCREAWLIAANRSGKSDAGAYVGASFARFGKKDQRFIGAAGSDISIKDRATSGWVSALDFPTSRDVIQPKYFDNGFTTPGQHPPFIPPHEIEEWRKSDQILKLKNGSLIGFKSAETGRSKYQGADKDWVHNDEEHPRDIYEEESIRVGARPLTIFNTVTLLPPEGMVGGVSWAFSEVIQPWQSGTLKNVMLFAMSIYDNPHIPAEEIEALEAKYPEGSVTRRIRLNGEWLPGLAGSRAYVAFSRMINVRPQPPINLRRPLAWMFDFNVEPMVSLIGQKDGDLFRVFREFVMDEGNTPDMVQMFYEAHPQHYSEVWVYGDATGKRRDTRSRTGESDYTIIMNGMRTYGVPVKMKVPEANPNVPDRINAMNIACKGLGGVVNLEVAPDCIELIADLEQVLRDSRGGIKKTHNKRDPYFRRTHTSDAAGYWISYEAPVRRTTASWKSRGKGIRSPGYGPSKPRKRGAHAPM